MRRLRLRIRMTRGLDKEHMLSFTPIKLLWSSLVIRELIQIELELRHS